MIGLVRLAAYWTRVTTNMSWVHSSTKQFYFLHILLSFLLSGISGQTNNDLLSPKPLAWRTSLYILTPSLTCSRPTFLMRNNKQRGTHPVRDARPRPKASVSHSFTADNRLWRTEWPIAMSESCSRTNQRWRADSLSRV